MDYDSICVLSGVGRRPCTRHRGRLARPAVIVPDV